MSPWPTISPAAAYLLMNPDWFRPGEALRITLVSLAARGAIRIEDMGQVGILHRCATALRPGAPMELHGHEAEVVRIVRENAETDPPYALPLSKFVELARKSFGSDYFMVRAEITQDLIDAGLFDEVRERYMLFLKKTRVRPSPLGYTWQQAALNRVGELKRVPDLLNVDPAKAVAIVAAAGGLVFLLPELQPHFPALSSALRAAQPTGDHGSSFVPLDITALGWFDSADLPAFESDFSAADSGGSGSGDGGDGGGDGGGGD